MGLTPRVQLVKVDPSILSSYGTKGGTGGSRSALLSLASLRNGVLTPDAAQGLLDLHIAVEEAGGDLRITDGFRDPGTQQAARLKYETWLAAGSPKQYDAKTMKNAYVARPGRSFHNGGRAIDIHVSMLKFPKVKKADKQLDLFWEIAQPLGWRPVIKAPDEGAKEAWHFDFMGPWGPVYDRVGYSQAAMCACMDIGEFAPFSLQRERAIQANLHRAGYDVGDIDGLIGTRTMAGLRMAGIAFKERTAQYDAAIKLESSGTPKWCR